jgi:hypothetical protein
MTMALDADIAMLELLPADVDETAVQCGPSSGCGRTNNTCNTLGTTCCGLETRVLCNPDWTTFSP